MQEYGAPTESEVQRLFGVSSCELGLERLDLTDECQKSITVFPISLFGIPDSKVRGMRVLKLTSRVRVKRGEHFLQTLTQVDENQGASWLTYLNNQLIKDRCDAKAGKRGLLRVSSYDDLHAKALVLQGVLTSEQISKYESDAEVADAHEPTTPRSPEPSADADGSDVYLFNASEAPSKKPRVMDPTAAVRRAAGELPEAETNRKRGAASRGRGTGRGRGDKKVKKEEEPAVPDEEEEDAEANKVDWEAFKERDPEMFEVAMKHYNLTNKVSSCFHYLDVASFLRNQKLGQVVNGVPQLPFVKGLVGFKGKAHADS